MLVVVVKSPVDWLEILPYFKNEATFQVALCSDSATRRLHYLFSCHYDHMMLVIKMLPLAPLPVFFLDRFTTIREKADKDHICTKPTNMARLTGPDRSTFFLPMIAKLAWYKTPCTSLNKFYFALIVFLRPFKFFFFFVMYSTGIILCRWSTTSLPKTPLTAFNEYPTVLVNDLSCFTFTSIDEKKKNSFTRFWKRAGYHMPLRLTDGERQANTLNTFVPPEGSYASLWEVHSGLFNVISLLPADVCPVV